MAKTHRPGHGAISSRRSRSVRHCGLGSGERPSVFWGRRCATSHTLQLSSSGSPAHSDAEHDGASSLGPGRWGTGHRPGEPGRCLALSHPHLLHDGHRLLPARDGRGDDRAATRHPSQRVRRAVPGHGLGRAPTCENRPSRFVDRCPGWVLSQRPPCSQPRGARAGRPDGSTDAGRTWVDRDRQRGAHSVRRYRPTRRCATSSEVLLQPLPN